MRAKTGEVRYSPSREGHSLRPSWHVESSLSCDDAASKLLRPSHNPLTSEELAAEHGSDVGKPIDYVRRQHPDLQAHVMGAEERPSGIQAAARTSFELGKCHFLARTTSPDPLILSVSLDASFSPLTPTPSLIGGWEPGSALTGCQPGSTALSINPKLLRVGGR